MPFYVPPEQWTKEKADYARKGIARGRPLLVLEYADGIVFVTENPSTHLHKVSELYDRIAFAAVGRFSEFESLRQAGVRLADIRGYAYGREDVTGRSIANTYSQALGQVFMQENKAYEVELCVAEVGTDGAPNALYHVIYDGTFVEPKGYLAMGGEAEALNVDLQRSYRDGMTLEEAVHLAVRTLRRGAPAGSEASSRLEVAVLDRHRSRRLFRRLSDEEVAAVIAGGEAKDTSGGEAKDTSGAAASPSTGSDGTTPPAGST
ncbi:MAG TPA: proteasome subunit alpha [Actinomycetes bacterium]|nr:proteasome subunit alpha [Actinomycetes bacterium]